MGYVRVPTNLSKEDIGLIAWQVSPEHWDTIQKEFAKASDVRSGDTGDSLNSLC
jgi:hypothetical protein